MKPELIPHRFFLAGCVCFFIGTIIAMVQAA
jgi:hypothetical protein